jgi:hypothetical protein
MYCNLPSPTLVQGSRVRWIFLSVGSTEGLHAPIFTRQSLSDSSGAHPSALLMPGYTSTMDMIAGVSEQGNKRTSLVLYLPFSFSSAPLASAPCCHFPSLVGFYTLPPLE